MTTGRRSAIVLGNLFGVLAVLIAAAWLWLQVPGSPRPDFSALLMDDPGAALRGVQWPGQVSSCRIPYQVRIGQIDPQFEVPASTLEAALLEAFALWEQHAPKPLFQLSSRRAATAVNLHFDDRQADTAALVRGHAIRARAASELERLQRELESNSAHYRARSDSFRSQQHAYERDQRLHARQVAAFNAAGSSDHQMRRRLLAEQDRLGLEGERLERALQSLAEAQRALVRQRERYNREVVLLNEQHANLNARSAERGRVTSGQYLRVGQHARIDVHVAASYEDLVWVLAHELGHALGMGHVAGARSVMGEVYARSYQRPRGRVVLSEQDIEALEAVCTQRW